MTGLKLPLYLYTPAPGIAWTHLIIEDAETQEVAYLKYHGHPPEVLAQAQAIVRACNSHDELVEALQGLLASPILIGNNPAALAAYDAAQHAVAKATKGE